MEVRFNAQFPREPAGADHFGGFVHVDIGGDGPVVAGDFVFLIANRFEKKRVSGNVDVRLGDLPLPGRDLGASDFESAAGVEVPENAPSEIDRLREAAVEPDQAHALLVDHQVSRHGGEDARAHTGWGELGVGARGKRDLAVAARDDGPEEGVWQHAHQLVGLLAIVGFGASRTLAHRRVNQQLLHMGKIGLMLLRAGRLAVIFDGFGKIAIRRLDDELDDVLFRGFVCVAVHPPAVIGRLDFDFVADDGGDNLLGRLGEGAAGLNGGQKGCDGQKNPQNPEGPYKSVHARR
jgi:hypothetical protein